MLVDKKQRIMISPFSVFKAITLPLFSLKRPCKKLIR